MKPPGEELKASLMSTALKYREQLNQNAEAVRYLEERGITEKTRIRFGLGFVADPEPEDTTFQGRLSIPYLVHSPVHGWSCVGFKFRDLTGESKAKYLYRKGLSPYLYNPPTLLDDTDYICVTEGELDTIAAVQAGMPAVGIPGATQWQPWYSRLFHGYSKVYILQDNDEAGEKMSAEWADKIPNVRVIVMPDGDVNETLVARGPEALREIVGVA